MTEQELFEAGECSAGPGCVVATREERMAEDRHRELAGRSLERPLEPFGLRRIDRLQDAGVDRDEREPIRLDLEERRALESCRDPVRHAQAFRLIDETLDPRVGRAGDPQIRLHPRPDARARRLWLKECGRERFERVVPIVVAWNRVHQAGLSP